MKHRQIHAIRKDLKALQVELENAQADRKLASACNILSNLGWTWDEGNTSWVSPKDVATVKARAHSDKGPIREGDFASYKGGNLGGNVMVRNLIPGTSKATVSWISNMTMQGCVAGKEAFTVELHQLTPRHRHWFIGK